MTLDSSHIDSFIKYDDLDRFLYRPLPDLLKECHNDVLNLKTWLRSNNKSIKGEIRTNCQAHDNSKNFEAYLYSIRSKLGDLLKDLLYPDTEKRSIYQVTSDNSLEAEFVIEIRDNFDKLFKFIDEFPRGEIRSPKAKPSKGGEKSAASHPCSYSLDERVDVETFKDCFVELKGTKFFSDETNMDQFIACFSGDSVPTKVRWKRQNALYYFITRLNQKELIKPIPNGIWETASECFSDKNGEPLDPGNLGRTKPPVNDKSGKIDDAIRLIKKNT